MTSDKHALTVLVVAPKDSDAIKVAPKYDPESPSTFPLLQHVSFLVLHTPDDVDTHTEIVSSARALLHVPSGDRDVLFTLHEKDLLQNIIWFHSFSAGIDTLRSFIDTCLLANSKYDDLIMTSGSGAFSSSLAEYTMASILHFNKSIPRCIENKANRIWDKFTMDVVAGKTIGFAGFGNIAQTTAKIAAAFGMKIVALRRKSSFDPSTDMIRADQYYSLDQKFEFLQMADFVVSSLPGTPHTHHFFSVHEFQAMKPTAVFISIGRGSVVDEMALVNALEGNQIVAAALDVYEVEPLPKDSPVWSAKNLLMTSHNADLTTNYFHLGWQVWYDNFVPFRQGCTDPSQYVTPVDKKAGY